VKALWHPIVALLDVANKIVKAFDIFFYESLFIFLFSSLPWCKNLAICCTKEYVKKMQ